VNKQALRDDSKTVDGEVLR